MASSYFFSISQTADTINVAKPTLAALIQVNLYKLYWQV